MTGEGKAAASRGEVVVLRPREEQAETGTAKKRACDLREGTRFEGFEKSVH